MEGRAAKEQNNGNCDDGDGDDDGDDDAVLYAALLPRTGIGEAEANKMQGKDRVGKGDTHTCTYPHPHRRSIVIPAHRNAHEQARIFRSQKLRAQTCVLDARRRMEGLHACALHLCHSFWMEGSVPSAEHM
eukprot:1161802-Pelagomonas_calceolata.AAC.21